MNAIKYIIMHVVLIVIKCSAKYLYLYVNELKLFLIFFLCKSYSKFSQYLSKYIRLKYKCMQYAASMDRRQRNGSLFSLRRTMCVCMCVIRRKETSWYYSQGLENVVWQYMSVYAKIYRFTAHTVEKSSSR